MLDHASRTTTIFPVVKLAKVDSDTPAVLIQFCELFASFLKMV